MYQKRVTDCAHRIKEALEVRNMKQADLCKYANVPKSSLSLYLSGAYEPKQERIYSMAKTLNVSEAWLMGYDVPMQKEKSPEEPKLLEGEEELLKLIRLMPAEMKALYIETLRATLKGLGLI